MDRSALTELLAKQEITEAIHKYCRAMDRMDNDLGRTVFHPDASVDYGVMFQGTGHGFMEFVHEAHAGMLVHHHQVGNILIRVEGQRAFSESYVTATFHSQSEGGPLLERRSYGRYVDIWESRDGRWAINHRTYLHAMDETRPVDSTAYPGWGRRDRSDPSYDGLKSGG
jgi:hypothetical protein